MSAPPDDLCPICRTRYRKVARNHGKPGTALRATCGVLECVKARKNATQAALYAKQFVCADTNDWRRCACGGHTHDWVDNWGQAWMRCERCGSNRLLGPRRFATSVPCFVTYEAA